MLGVYTEALTLVSCCHSLPNQPSVCCVGFYVLAFTIAARDIGLVWQSYTEPNVNYLTTGFHRLLTLVSCKL